MLKYFIVVIFTLLTKSSFCQTNLVFKNFKFDASYQLIGVPYYYDTDKTYQSLSFLINDTATLNKAKMTVTYGPKIDSPTVEYNSLSIYVVKNKKVVRQLDVSPKYGNIGIADSDISTIGNTSLKFQRF